MSRSRNFAKLDELYDDNRKVKRAWRRNRAAVGLHAQAITYAKRHNTDGVVDVEWLEDKLPSEKERVKVLEVLVEVGLFEPVDADSYRVHDFLDWQTSTAERKRRVEQARAAANARWDATRNATSMQDACVPHSGPDSESHADRNAEVEVEVEEEVKALSGRPDVTEIETARQRVRREARQRVFDAWVKSAGRTGRTVFDAKRQRIVDRALENFPAEDLVDAVEGWKYSPHHRGENDRQTIYNDLELLLRDSAHIERFRDLTRRHRGGGNRLDRVGGTA